MIDRIFTLALAAGLLALAASTVVGFGKGYAYLEPRMVQFERVTINGKRIAATDLVSTAIR